MRRRERAVPAHLPQLVLPSRERYCVRHDMRSQVELVVQPTGRHQQQHHRSGQTGRRNHMRAGDKRLLLCAQLDRSVGRVPEESLLSGRLRSRPARPVLGQVRGARCPTRLQNKRRERLQTRAEQNNFQNQH